MSIVIRLDVPALERLIGGDTEAEIHIRKGIVQEFARHHLNAIAKDAEFAAFVSQEAKVTRLALEEKLRIHVGTYKERGYTTEIVHLSEAAKEAVEAEANKQFGKHISDAATRVWKEKIEPKLDAWVDRLLVGYVSEAVRKHISTITEDLVREQVQKRLEEIKTKLTA